MRNVCILLSYMWLKPKEYREPLKLNCRNKYPNLKMGKECQTWGHMPLILALQRQEAGGSRVRNQPRLHETLPPRESKVRLRVWFTDAQCMRAWLWCSALHESQTVVQSVCLSVIPALGRQECPVEDGAEVRCGGSDVKKSYSVFTLTKAFPKWNMTTS